MPQLDEYWTKVFDLRVNQGCWTTRAPLVDLFKTVQLCSPDKKGLRFDNKAHGKELACIIPIEDARSFWEAVLAFYVIYRPELFENEAQVAKMLIHFMEHELKLEPQGLTQDVVQFLHVVAHGQYSLVFWEYPVETFIAMRVLQMAAASQQSFATEGAQQMQINIWAEQAFKVEGERLKETEDEFKQLFNESYGEVFSRAKKPTYLEAVIKMETQKNGEEQMKMLEWKKDAECENK